MKYQPTNFTNNRAQYKIDKVSAQIYNYKNKPAKQKQTNNSTIKLKQDQIYFSSCSLHPSELLSADMATYNL